ncbi:hypothetical protein HDG33_000146 [Paraburkholderia sp. Cpub6]|nr:hypothetical protein [Paraburkholderia sp. Cpub6]
MFFVDVPAVRRVIADSVVAVVVLFVRAGRIAQYQRHSVEQIVDSPFSPDPREEFEIGFPHLPDMVPLWVAFAQTGRAQLHHDRKVITLLEYPVGDVHHARVLKDPALAVLRGQPQPGAHDEAVMGAPVVGAGLFHACDEARNRAGARARVCHVTGFQLLLTEQSVPVERDRNVDDFANQVIGYDQFLCLPQSERRTFDRRHIERVSIELAQGFGAAQAQRSQQRLIAPRG